MATSIHARFLQDARTLLEQASGLPELASELKEYGYTPGKFQEGFKLLEEAEVLSRRKAVEYGEKYESSAKLVKAWKGANVLYQKALKVARVVLRDAPKSTEALGLGGPRNLSVSGWYEQAGDFYANLLANDGYVRALGAFGYSRERLVEERRVIEAVMDTRDETAIEAAQAKAVTAARDRKLKELDDWVSDLRAICEVAFYEKRDELPKLGPLAPTVRRHSGGKKKVKAA